MGLALGAAGASAAQDLGDVRDRLAIAEQLAQYSYRWDGKDAVGFAALFTEDGVLERWRDGAAIPGSVVRGREAILEYARTSHTGRLADRQTRRHLSGWCSWSSMPSPRTWR